MNIQRAIAALVGGCLLTLSASADWRKDADADEQLRQLVGLVPGTAHWMFEVGERYKNLYWAARQERWDFAQYQVEEIDKLIQVVQRARPNRAATAQEFLDSGIPEIQKGVEGRSWQSFEPAFAKLHDTCMACHVKNDHAFIVLPLAPASAGSPVLNLPQD